MATKLLLAVGATMVSILGTVEAERQKTARPSPKQGNAKAADPRRAADFIPDKDISMSQGSALRCKDPKERGRKRGLYQSIEHPALLSLSPSLKLLL